MDRRGFIQQLLMATAAAQLVDIEQLLWTPRSMIAVPSTYVTGSGFINEVVVQSGFGRQVVRYLFESTVTLHPGDFVSLTPAGLVVRAASGHQRIVGMVESTRTKAPKFDADGSGRG